MKKWSATTTAAGLGLVASLALTSATLVQFKQSLEAMSAHERGRIAFNEYEVRPVPHFLLGMDAPDEARHPSCEISDQSGKNGSAEILIAISKCLSDTAVDNIKAWIASINKNTLKHTNSDGSITELKFVTTLIEDDCPNGGPPTTNDTPKDGEDNTTATDDGGAYAYKSQSLLAAAPRAMQRVQAFAGFGRVLADASEIVPIAVLSFADSSKSFNYVQTYKAEKKITNVFNFQMCLSPTSCSQTFKDSIKLTQPVDLFLYNPFKIIRSLECKKLDGGIPVTYTASANQKQKCFCMCPVGTEYTPGDGYGKGPSCVKPEDTTPCDCVWKQPSECYHHDNTEPLDKCLFTNLSTSWKVPAPFPLDNYVAAGRTNVKDGPQINLVVTRKATEVFTYDSLNTLYGASHPGKSLAVDTIQSNSKEKMIKELADGKTDVSTPTSTPEAEGKAVLSKTYTWKDYQQNRVAKIDSIELKTYGKYKLELEASDYVTTRNATCEGCVSVVDKFRPKSKLTCPARVCDSTGSCKSDTAPGCVEATSDQLENLSKLVYTVYKFPKEVINDACSSKRCDTAEFSLKDWFEKDYCDTTTSFDEGKTCLDKANLKKTLKESLKSVQNPLETYGGAKQDDVPVAAFSCRRCCKYGVELKEWWTDYKCENDDYDISRCEGRDTPEGKCKFEQCVVLDGKTLASASVCVKDRIRTESQKVIDQLEVKGFQSVTQVHRALTCTAFDSSKPAKPECIYEAAIGDLVDATYKTEFFDGDASKFVFWRYKITGDAAGWRLWDPKTNPKPADKYKFTEPATKITIEAWTACGRVHQSFYFVHLHPQIDIKVCEFFPKMWYQTTVSKTVFEPTLCAYPGSDFAELTFEYQANIGLQYSRDALRMEVTGVQCDLSIEGRKPAQILSVTGNSMDIFERYAVQMQTLKTTSPNTKFKVTCTFTYTRFDNATKVVPCEQSFTITDCDKPTIDTPGGNCAYDNCVDQPLPGPYEACGGNVVTSTASVTNFTVMTGDKCCQGCADSKTTCTSILQLTEGSDDDIKRCVPETPVDEYNAYGSDTSNYGTYSAAAYMAQAAARHPTVAAATALLAASAMVGLVALVVVRQRRTAAHNEVVIEDAYYPLLN